MSSRILVSLRIAAPPEVVFDAFVDDIALWWRPNTLFSFTPRSPAGFADDALKAAKPSATATAAAIAQLLLVREIMGLSIRENSVREIDRKASPAPAP